jgi:hypothetical protein
MRKNITKDMTPIFYKYGTACFAAANLETGLEQLLQLNDYHRKKKLKGISFGVTEDIKSLRVLGKMFDEAKRREYFNDIEAQKVKKAIRTRNHLVHCFWNERVVLEVTSTAGRKKMIVTLNEIFKIISDGTDVVNSFINNYLSDYGLNLDVFGKLSEQNWESREKELDGFLEDL